MANGLYQSEGIILNLFDVGEADRIVTVFTKEFGLLKIFARGVRQTRSKLNKFLNTFSYIRVGFVSGKDSWHLVDAEDLVHFDNICTSAEKMKLLGHSTRFLERFQATEVREPVIFELIFSLFRFLEQAGEDLLEDVEILFKARTLLVLGYLNEEILHRDTSQADQTQLAKLLSDTVFSEADLPMPDHLKENFLKHISEGSELSHL